MPEVRQPLISSRDRAAWLVTVRGKSNRPTGLIRGAKKFRRSICLLWVPLIGLAACAISPAPKNSTDELATFVEQRDTCDHFRGEPSDTVSEERLKEIADGIRRFCTGTDGRLAELKRRYANNALVLKRLDEYEEFIETARSP